MDNGSQFNSTRFEALCEKWKIRLTKSTPRYPQCNGQAETINKTILDEIKKRFDAKSVGGPKNLKDFYGRIAQLQDVQQEKLHSLSFTEHNV